MARRANAKEVGKLVSSQQASADQAMANYVDFLIGQMFLGKSAHICELGLSLNGDTEELRSLSLEDLHILHGAAQVGLMMALTRVNERMIEKAEENGDDAMLEVVTANDAQE